MEADIEMNGGLGLYTVRALTDAGQEFVFAHVNYQPWQGNPRRGIAIEGSVVAEAIAAGALDVGCRVCVNGKEL
jgi:hypothetical protein